MGIYVSYSSQDKSAAQNLVAILSRENIRLDDPDDTLSQKNQIEHSISSKIKEARAVIVLLSHHSKTSSWLAFEIGAAMALGIDILPILLTESQDDVPSYLKHLQIRKLSPELYEELKQLF